MNLQSLLAAVALILGIQKLCDAQGVDPYVSIFLQVGTAMFVPRMLASWMQKNVAGQKAPELTGLQYVQGNQCELGAGKVSVVEFWATWCPPCKTSIPHLNELYQQYKDKGVEFVGITTEKAEPAKAFLDKTPAFAYPCACDAGGKISSAYGVQGIPAAFVVNGEGVIIWQGHPMKGLGEAIEAGLKGPEAAKADAPKDK